ncbi:hypothetical protein ALT785_620027 [Alteromonas infernus]
MASFSDNILYFVAGDNKEMRSKALSLIQERPIKQKKPRLVSGA